MNKKILTFINIVHEDTNKNSPTQKYLFWIKLPMGIIVKSLFQHGGITRGDVEAIIFWRQQINSIL